MAYNVLQISEGKDLETKILIKKQNIIMKTRTLINRRHFAFAYVLLVAVIFCGCEDETIKQTIKEEEVFDAKLGRFNNKFRIVVIDSCEYLYTDAGNNGQTVFHKGNCKFCVERSKK